MAADRLGEGELVGRLDPGVADVVVAVGTHVVAQQARDVPDEGAVGG